MYAPVQIGKITRVRSAYYKHDIYVHNTNEKLFSMDYNILFVW